jgi:hypothetical protein
MTNVAPDPIFHIASGFLAAKHLFVVERDRDLRILVASPGVGSRRRHGIVDGSGISEVFSFGVYAL